MGRILNINNLFRWIDPTTFPGAPPHSVTVVLHEKSTGSGNWIMREPFWVEDQVHGQSEW